MTNPHKGWCDVHEVNHPREETLVYEVSFIKNKGEIHVRWQLCNAVAMTLGLTTRDPIVRDEDAS